MAIKHTVRNGKGGTIEAKLTPIKAIRLQCIECMGFQAAFVKKCSSPLCSLFPFRMGKTHSGIKGNLDNLKKYRKNPSTAGVFASTIDERQQGRGNVRGNFLLTP